jgi:hypothetical protein
VSDLCGPLAASSALVTTLRRAFDMKDVQWLALMIVRGRYPPIPSTFSRDQALTSAALLHMNAAERPQHHQALYCVRLCKY